MNDEPQSPYEPPSAPVQSQSVNDGRGSRWAGFGWYWLITVGGGFLMPMLTIIPMYTFQQIPGIIVQLIALSPLLLALILGVRFAVKGKMRTAQGMLFGFLSQIALVLLFVAACFGIIALNGGLKF
jgi:hypothetical protein